MMSWVAAVVRVIAQASCGSRRCGVDGDIVQGSLSEGCSSSRAQSIDRPSSLGGVPVFIRAIGSAKLRS